MAYLLDTSVLSELRKGARCQPHVARWASTAAPGIFHTSVLVIGEIRRGIERVRRKDSRQATVFETWLEQVQTAFADRIHGVDERIAEEWGRMSVPDPLPVIDGLLAATAKVHGLTLATRDVADVARTGVPAIDPFSAQR
ncbi:MAG: type II toxin-antitoxin system VapC family toxin [Rhodospirillales bacterium]|nr:type II toxin-antitoxin system VapC family toxin [Rhodospirillales bacterium]